MIGEMVTIRLQSSSGLIMNLISPSNGYVCTRQMTARLYLDSGPFLPAAYNSILFPPRFVETMASTSQPKGHDDALSTLDLVIQTLTLAKDTCGIPPAQVALGSAVALLTMIKVYFPPTPR
jgi:hypothetical protein